MISSEIVTLLRLKNSKVQRSMLKKLISCVNYIIINYIELLRAPFHDEAILLRSRIVYYTQLHELRLNPSCHEFSSRIDISFISYICIFLQGK